MTGQHPMLATLPPPPPPKWHLPCFKSYDIRGRVPDELSDELAYRLGLAYARAFSCHNVAVGRDVRPSGTTLVNSLALGLEHGGADVVDLGLCGTEEVYFAAFQDGIDGGIMVTASHNPADYNGFKLVREGAIPVSGDSGLRDLEREVSRMKLRPRGAAVPRVLSLRGSYVRHLLGYVDVDALRPLTVAVNPGNGSAGLILDALEPHLPLVLKRTQAEPDGRFPNGVPNPLLPKNRTETVRHVLCTGADFGVAWDGDGDRCFFFDEQGRFIEGYYIVGLLAEVMLRRHPGAAIVHDPRLTWNTEEIIRAGGGRAVESKTGHAFIKERMRAEDAVYGGEMSAHHYFRDFAYCDNGTIPWLLIAQLISEAGVPLSELVEARKRRFPVSGEINRVVDDVDRCLGRIEAHYANGARSVRRTDGVSIDRGRWRFNVRASNTEPLIRLNVETRGDEQLVSACTHEILSVIGGRPA